jgi:hypothetical protein
MADTPEDRGPDSMRVVKYNPKNPIHEGLMRSRIKEDNVLGQSISTNPNIQLPNYNDKKPVIKMPVKLGMEKEPELSEKYYELIQNKPYVLPEEHQIKLPKPKPVIKTDAPSMKEVKNVGDIYKKTDTVASKKNRAEEQAAIQKKIAARLAKNRKPK